MYIKMFKKAKNFKSSLTSLEPDHLKILLSCAQFADKNGFYFFENDGGYIIEERIHPKLFKIFIDKSYLVPIPDNQKSKLNYDINHELLSLYKKGEL